MSENSRHIAVIGLGAMGLPMAAHLATKFSVTGFDPFEGRRELAAEQGVAAEATPSGACRNADIALLAVRDQSQAESALFGEEGVLESLKPGSPVILTSTIGPEAARALAGQLDEAGYPLIDAPISGGPARAGQGDLLIVVGATEAALAAAQPVLDHLASTLTIVGTRPGDGQALKTINQLLAGVHIAAAAEAIALARGLGLDPAVVISALAQGAAGLVHVLRSRTAHAAGLYRRRRGQVARRHLCQGHGNRDQRRSRVSRSAAAGRCSRTAVSHRRGSRARCPGRLKCGHHPVARHRQGRRLRPQTCPRPAQQSLGSRPSAGK